MRQFSRTNQDGYLKRNAHKRLILLCLLALLALLFFVSLMIGSSNMSFGESFMALFGQGQSSSIRIVQNIRLPRALAALIAGAALSLAGLIMQSTLGNIMASPSVLGVSNAAVFGANLSIIIFAGGYASVGNKADTMITSANPFSTSTMAFVFAAGSILLILGLCRVKGFSPNAVILAGVAMGATWTAGTTILQYTATDVGLSAAVVWSFGDLGRASFTTDLIMAIVLAIGTVFALVFSYRFNAMLSGQEVASSLGMKVGLFRFFSLLVASLLTAVCVSYLGIIGFVGMICPHSMRRILGNNHRFLIPASLLSGAFLVLLADSLSRIIANGMSLPVGAVTSLLGAPFFLYLIFAKKEGTV